MGLATAPWIGSMTTFAMPQYESIAQRASRQYGIQVRRWRRTLSGRAILVRHADGRVDRWIESPRPRSPVSLAVFLHEVGHHAVGFRRCWSLCEEEMRVWEWALNRMRRAGIDPNRRVLARVERSMRHALALAMRKSPGPPAGAGHARPADSSTQTQ